MQYVTIGGTDYQTVKAAVEGLFPCADETALSMTMADKHESIW